MNINKEVSYAEDTIFAKQQLPKESTDTKILGIHWIENEDKLSIKIPKSKGKYTRRNILNHLASIYDSLGYISSAHLLGKIVYQESCELKLPWTKWLTFSPSKIIIPRSIPLPDAKINHTDIHAFRNSNIMGTCAVAYAIVFQPDETQ